MRKFCRYRIFNPITLRLTVRLISALFRKHLKKIGIWNTLYICMYENQVVLTLNELLIVNLIVRGCVGNQPALDVDALIRQQSAKGGAPASPTGSLASLASQNIGTPR